jgi:hypothetical protein
METAAMQFAAQHPEMVQQFLSGQGAGASPQYAPYGSQAPYGAPYGAPYAPQYGAPPPPPQYYYQPPPGRPWYAYLIVIILVLIALGLFIGGYYYMCGTSFPLICFFNGLTGAFNQ